MPTIAGTSLFSIGCMERQLAVFFGVDLGNGLDHNSLSRLADGTPYSSSDLLYFTLLLPFTWTNYSQSPTPFLPFAFWTKIFSVQISLLSFFFVQKFSQSKFFFSLLFGRKYSKSNFNFPKLFSDNSKICLSRKIIPILQKYSKSHLLSDSEKFLLFCLPCAYSSRWSLKNAH